MERAPENVVGEVIKRWFSAAVSDAWKHFDGGDQVRALVGDIDDPLERRTRQRFVQSEVAEHRLDDLRAAWAAGDYRDGVEPARQVVAELDAAIPEDSRQFAVIAKELMRAEGEVADATVRWAEGDIAYTPEFRPELPAALFPVPVPVELPRAVKVEPAAVVVASVEKPASGVTVSELLRRYMREAALKPSSEQVATVCVRRFVEVNGDLDVLRVEKRHVVALKDMLLRLPVDLSNPERKMPLPELVAKYDDRPELPRVQAGTVNTAGLSALRAIFAWGQQNDLMPSNPAAGVKALVKRDAGPARLPYGLDDLRAIFAMDPFTKGTRPVGAGGDAVAWLPVLAAFSGCRIEELGRLTVGDVMERDGVRYMAIKDGKTAAARRSVPLHSQVIALGFMDYVKARGNKPETPLFPDLGKKRAGVPVTSALSQWWSREARKVVPDPRKTFHSFRHGVKRALRNAGVDPVLRDAVMGHALDGAAEGYGLDENGEGYALPVLAAAIEKIAYPGLVITLAPAAPGTR